MSDNFSLQGFGTRGDSKDFHLTFKSLKLSLNCCEHWRGGDAVYCVAEREKLQKRKVILAVDENLSKHGRVQESRRDNTRYINYNSLEKFFLF